MPSPREGKFNKNAARRVRAKGKVPAVVYGAAQPAVAVEVDPKQIQKILHSDAGHNSIFDLAVAGSTAKVMIVDWQYEPIKGNLIHIDFKRIALDKPIRVEVPIQLTGVAVGVKTQGGILDQMLREVEIECLPGDIPETSASTSPISPSAWCCASPICRTPAAFVSSRRRRRRLRTWFPIKEEVVATPEAEAAVAGAAPAEPEVAKKGKTGTAEGAAAAAPAAEKGGKK